MLSCSFILSGDYQKGKGAIVCNGAGCASNDSGALAVPLRRPLPAAVGGDVPAVLLLRVTTPTDEGGLFLGVTIAERGYRVWRDLHHLFMCSGGPRPN